MPSQTAGIFVLTPIQRLPLVLSLALLATGARVAASSPDSFPSAIQPALEQHCVKCHGKDGKVKGKVNLLELGSAADLGARPDLLEDMISALEFEEMPPEDEAQPSARTRADLIANLRNILHNRVASQKHYPPSPIRRMNRFQYNNAVQDLFALNRVVFPLPERMMREYKDYFQPASGAMPPEVTVGSRPLGKSQLIEPRLAGVAPFPQDLRAEHGFDNRGDHLSLSPFLLESFLKLSRSIVESPDFNEKNCGLWKDFFAPPRGEASARAVRTRLRPFLTSAFRRPVDQTLLERYTAHVTGRLASGEDFTTAMKAAASAAIASPRFLYLYDTPGSGSAAVPVDDFDLASRLSFFLWGSLPDDELLNLAAAGNLSESEVLSGQIDRLLDDRRLKRFCDSFPAQWLQLDRIISAIPDRAKFPEFYSRGEGQYRLSMDQSLEPLLLFETVLVENRSILDLIDPDFTYRSDLLNEAYGNENPGETRRDPVASLPFTRIALTDRREGGVITNQAVMTMTSGADRTHPITRGAWLATVIFNDPPDPPPADVPPLAEEPPSEEEHLTLRERLSAHRERADCAGCHEKIDPLGFALENYGPTGQWRDEYANGRAVDMEGKLFRKYEFTNIIEFKDAILAEKDRFIRAFAGHLLSFALARELNPADGPALDKISANTAADGYRIQTLLKEVALSEPFLTKSNPSIPAETASNQ